MTGPGQDPGSEAGVHVAVRLTGPLGKALGGSELVGPIAEQVCAQLGDVARALGLPARMETSVTVGDEEQPSEGLTLHVNGVRCRYPDRLLAEVASADRGQWLGVDDPPDSWAAAVEQPERLARLVGNACAEAVKLQPACLFPAGVVAAYAGSLRSSSPVALALDDVRLGDVLRPVVELGIGIGDHATVAELLEEFEDATARQASEALIGALAPDTLDVVVPKDLLPAIGVGDERDPNDGLAFAARGLFEESGTVVPRLCTQASDEAARTFHFRINSLPTLPRPVLPDGTCLVNAGMEQLRALASKGQTVVNPATGRPAALVPSESRAELEAAGYTVWDRAGHVILELAEAVRRHAPALVTQDRLLAQLDVLEEWWPTVVRFARAQLPPAELTFLLRTLARGSVSLRDLRAVLERVVDLPAADLAWTRYAVLGDPVGSPRAARVVVPPEYDPVEAFLRVGLREAIARRHASGPHTLVTYLVSPQVESLACSPGRTEADDDAILDAVRRELAFLPATARPPGILTTATARRSVQEIVRATYPRMVVLSFDDLPSTVHVQPIARLSLE